MVKVLFKMYIYTSYSFQVKHTADNTCAHTKDIINMGNTNAFFIEKMSSLTGFPGIQIGSHVNEWNLDAEELRPVFAVCLCYFTKAFKLWKCPMKYI